MCSGVPKRGCGGHSRATRLLFFSYLGWATFFFFFGGWERFTTLRLKERTRSGSSPGNISSRYATAHKPTISAAQGPPMFVPTLVLNHHHHHHHRMMWQDVYLSMRPHVSLYPRCPGSSLTMILHHTGVLGVSLIICFVQPLPLLPMISSVDTMFSLDVGSAHLSLLLV